MLEELKNKVNGLRAYWLIIIWIVGLVNGILYGVKSIDYAIIVTIATVGATSIVVAFKRGD